VRCDVRIGTSGCHYKHWVGYAAQNALALKQMALGEPGERAA